MKEDMMKIFGKEFFYLKGLKKSERLTIVWFIVSLWLTAVLADANILAAAVALLSMMVSGRMLKRLPKFDD